MPDESRAERWLAPFFSESTLWPVTLVVFLVLGSFGSALLLLAFADRNLFATGALLGLMWMSVDALYSSVSRGSLGAIGFSIVALWTLSGLGALGALWLGLF